MFGTQSWKFEILGFKRCHSVWFHLKNCFECFLYFASVLCFIFFYFFLLDNTNWSLRTKSIRHIVIINMTFNFYFSCYFIYCIVQLLFILVVFIATMIFLMDFFFLILYTENEIIVTFTTKSIINYFSYFFFKVKFHNNKWLRRNVLRNNHFKYFLLFTCVCLYI